ncbi:uncharacterized protein J3D65DRAFT_612354, partial [Phyllosticta citribraziliensis]
MLDALTLWSSGAAHGGSAELCLGPVLPEKSAASCWRQRVSVAVLLMQIPGFELVVKVKEAKAVGRWSDGGSAELSLGPVLLEKSAARCWEVREFLSLISDAISGFVLDVKVKVKAFGHWSIFEARGAAVREEGTASVPRLKLNAAQMADILVVVVDVNFGGRISKSWCWCRASWR